MPKLRSRNQVPSQPDLDAFIHQPEHKAAPSLDPQAPRKYKTITIPLNEYEYTILKDACRKSGRSAKNLFRYSMLKYAEEVSE